MHRAAMKFEHSF